MSTKVSQMCMYVKMITFRGFYIIIMNHAYHSHWLQDFHVENQVSEGEWWLRIRRDPSKIMKINFILNVMLLNFN